MSYDKLFIDHMAQQTRELEDYSSHHPIMQTKTKKKTPAKQRRTVKRANSVVQPWLTLYPVTTLINFWVDGVKHWDTQLAATDEFNFKAGAPVQLVWERNNPMDANAIRINFGSYKLGYVPRELTHKLHWQRIAGRKLIAHIEAYWPANPSHCALRVVVSVVGQPEPDNNNEINLG